MGLLALRLDIIVSCSDEVLKLFDGAKLEPILEEFLGYEVLSRS